MKFNFIWILVFLSSCTMTFQNVSTIGTNSDVIDDEMTNDPQIEANVSASGI